MKKMFFVTVFVLALFSISSLGAFTLAGYLEGRNTDNNEYVQPGNSNDNGSKTPQPEPAPDPEPTPEPELPPEPEPEPNPEGELRTYTATFNANGATSIGATKLSCTTTGTTCTVKAPTITRSGHTVLGWSRSKNGGSNIKVESNIALTSDTAYFAITTPTETIFTATFNRNTADGIGRTSVSCKTASTSCTIELPSISANNQVIIGWSANRDGRNPITPGSNVTLTGNRTYFAITQTQAPTTFSIATVAGDSLIIRQTGEFEYTISGESTRDFISLRMNAPTNLADAGGSYKISTNPNSLNSLQSNPIASRTVAINLSPGNGGWNEDSTGTRAVSFFVSADWGSGIDKNIVYRINLRVYRAG